MYSEKTFKNYIFWLQVRRLFLIIIFSCIGAALGAGISALLQNILNISQYRYIIVTVSTVIFFIISLLLTATTGKEVQDGYWKIAMLRKLTVIQKNLELNNELLSRAIKSQKLPKTVIEESKAITKKIVDAEKEIVEGKTEKINNKSEVVKESKPSVKKRKLKMPEEVNN
jgi:hypothetical protein